jgi:hypothetical protein
MCKHPHCMHACAQVSVVDQAPQELLAAALLGIHVRYAAGLGAGGATDSLRLSVDSVQLDDELPGTRRAGCPPCPPVRMSGCIIRDPSELTCQRDERHVTV